MVSQHKYIFMSLVNLICGGILEVNSVVRRIEKRTKKILLPEWSSGGVNLKSFYLHCWNGPWRRCMFVLAKFFISVAVIVLGRRFSIARTGCIVSLEKSYYLLLHEICCPQSMSVFISTRARIKNGMFIIVWLYCILCSLTCCYLVLYLFMSYLRMLRLLVLCEGLSIPKSLIKQEVPDMCCSYHFRSFVFELRRCVGIRMCNSNTSMDISLFLIVLPRIMRVDEC